MTELVRGMGLFLVWCHRVICIALSLCKHACKEVCAVNPEIDPYPLLAPSCDRWWPDFITFTACKKSRFGLERGKKAQCISNRCKDLFEQKNYFGVKCTATITFILFINLWAQDFYEMIVDEAKAWINYQSRVNNLIINIKWTELSLEICSCLRACSHFF